MGRTLGFQQSEETEGRCGTDNMELFEKDDFIISSAC